MKPLVGNITPGYPRGGLKCTRPNRVGRADEIPADSIRTVRRAKLQEASSGVGIGPIFLVQLEIWLYPIRTITRNRLGNLSCNPAPRIYKGSRGTPRGQRIQQLTTRSYLHRLWPSQSAPEHRNNIATNRT